jgi:hypothetical protein
VALPVVGFINGGAADATARFAAAFRKGLGETGSAIASSRFAA